MQEGLVRQELPIQAIYERRGACTATVPVNLDIIKLPSRIRTNLSLIAEARDTVGTWYDEDMVYHLGLLRRYGDYEAQLLQLKPYERFRNEWLLGGEPDKNGFLALSWRENGEVHNMRFNPVPVVLCNLHDEFDEFYTPESLTQGGHLIEIIYRNMIDPEFVAMSPEKMRKYGKETDIARIHEDRGLAEVVGNAFSSGYDMNMAKTLLLRDFAVFYLNRLLSVAKEQP